MSELNDAIAKAVKQVYKQRFDMGTRGCETLRNGQPISAIFLTGHMRESEVKPVAKHCWVINHPCGKTTCAGCSYADDNRK